jgi:hypothetical protein
MDKMQKNMKTVRLDQLINITTWVNTSFIAKIKQSPIAKCTPTVVELAPNIKTSNYRGDPNGKNAKKCANCAS